MIAVSIEFRACSISATEGGCVRIASISCSMARSSSSAVWPGRAVAWI